MSCCVFSNIPVVKVRKALVPIFAAQPVGVRPGCRSAVTLISTWKANAAS